MLIQQLVFIALEHYIIIVKLFKHLKQASIPTALSVKILLYTEDGHGQHLAEA